MNNDLINSILEFMPLMHRKLFREFKHNRVRGHSNRILFSVMHDDGETMSHYCNILSMPKPNFTKSSNRLIEEGLLIRKTDDNDRRKIRIFITEEGKSVIRNIRDEMKSTLSNKLELLSKDDIDKLEENFESIEKILNKLKD